MKEGMALVLDGGGGKGAYQIGVLKALKEQGYLDDVKGISGASIGAVNSLLYAMDDVELMYKAWKEIDMDTVFDIELDMLAEKKLYFSRHEMISMLEKYIDFDKILDGRYEIYHSLCKLNSELQPLEAEYRKLSDYDVETIKNILLASTSMPVIYEPVKIGDNYYRDGGIVDNEPIQPLYDAGYRMFIVIGLNSAKKFDGSKWPDASFITIYPSYDLGDLIDGTLDFSDKSKEFRELLGYKDGLRAIKTKFEGDEVYIRMEPVLARNDYNDVMMQVRVNQTYNAVESRINSNLDKFESIAKKYENL